MSREFPGVDAPMTLILAIPLVMLGGTIGALARYLALALVSARTSLPGWCGILVVNLLGSFLIGFFVNWLTLEQAGLRLGPLSPLDLEIERIEHGELLALTAVGFCGAFTTFSSFALDNVFLAIEDRRWLVANIVASVGACFLAVLGGWTLGGMVTA